MGIAPGMTELWASTGAIWRDMLLAEALVVLSHGVFQSRLKTFLFSKSLNPSTAICPLLRLISCVLSLVVLTVTGGVALEGKCSRLTL